MTQDEIIEMARQAGKFKDGVFPEPWIPFFVDFAKLVEEKATEKANARANASWTLMCKKMVALEREAIIQIIKETLFDDCFQADVIDAIRARSGGE